MGGTFDKASFRRFNAQYAGSPVGTAGDGLVGACTLLGPEGPDTLRGGDSSGSFPAAGIVWQLRGGYRPYFENYTVDASILKVWCVSIASKR